MAIPVGDPADPGGSGIIPNAPPTARVGATPNPVVVPRPSRGQPDHRHPVQALRLGTLVTFNAAASTDLDGSISKYEWNSWAPGYETTTVVPKTTLRFATPGLFPARSA
jgi:hypothetical protein